MRFFWLLALAACTPAPSPQPVVYPQPQPQLPPQPTAPAQPPAQPTTAFDEVTQPKGHLATAAIQKVVRADFNAMIACYEAGLARNPNLPGSKVRVRIVIAQDGRVASAANEPNASTSHTTLSAAVEGNEPPLTDPAVVACVVAEFRKLVFPRPDGGIVVATYPLIFSSQ